MKVQQIINKMDRKIGRYAIHGIILYIVIGMGVLFAFDWLFPDLELTAYFAFDRNLIMQGQVWRVVSFIIMPNTFNPIFMLINMYFYWFCGTNLEKNWGSFKFNLFYFTGMIGSMLGGVIIGYATNFYINMSLFLAFAILYPNQEFLIFFVLPVKAKYLAYAAVAYLLLSMIFLPLYGKIAILIAFLNIILFFGDVLYSKIYNKFKYRKVRRNFKINKINMTRYNEDDDE